MVLRACHGIHRQYRYTPVQRSPDSTKGDPGQHTACNAPVGSLEDVQMGSMRESLEFSDGGKVGKPDAIMGEHHLEAGGTAGEGSPLDAVGGSNSS